MRWQQEIPPAAACSKELVSSQDFVAFNLGQQASQEFAAALIVLTLPSALLILNPIEQALFAGRLPVHVQPINVVGKYVGEAYRVLLAS